jgi:hypothetical protein
MCYVEKCQLEVQTIEMMIARICWTSVLAQMENGQMKKMEV